MKKVNLLICLAFFLFLAACGNASTTQKPAEDSNSAPNESPKQESYTLKLSHGYPAEAFHHTHMVWFADEVEKRSDGKLKIEIFPNGQLMPESQEIPAIIQGQIDMSHANSANISSVDPLWNVYDLPFIFDYDQKNPLSYLENREKFNNSETGGQILAKGLEDKGLKLLAFSTTGTFGAAFTTSTDNAITTPDTAKGLKIRTPGSIITPETVRAMGANSMTLAGTELITALQTNVIDGLLTSASYAADAALPINTFLVAPLFNPITTVIISLDKFESLPEELQHVLVETGKDLQTYVKEVIAENELKAYEKLQNEMGVEFYYPTPEEIEEWREITKPAIELYEKEIEGGEEIIKGLSID
ncbi:TRAP transporter substrate-binding protein [Bacillus sp. B15-48]|uniref:TRAP transporter substrate-binding protein n=1 Tax=Bacillus sp. B15-48 TaxID=1548601 RepID=UPI00193FE406|nr:TRAP transporter substrate-binding protein [Bacillus sp. B15-48]MBM4763664.1 hypothetical protein [Bacillus sp. B15-48]